MFTQNIHFAKNLSRIHHANKYFLLYYQFIKHAFGLQYCNVDNICLEIYFDKFKLLRSKSKFISCLKNINNLKEFNNKNLEINLTNLREVDSKENVILQCVDIILGAMQFRLNEKHKIKEPGSRFRGKRTRAKEKLYKHINKRIRDIYSGFNIGCSTSNWPKANRWDHNYRHWLLVPREFDWDFSRTKSANKKTR